MSQTRTLFGFDSFDITVIVMEAILFIPAVQKEVFTIDKPWSTIIGIGFFVGLYLKRYDPDYSRGVQFLSEKYGGITEWITLLGGALVGGMLGALYVIGGILGVLGLITGLGREGVFNSWYSLFIVLPLVPLCLAAIPSAYFMAGSAPEKFLIKAPKGKKLLLRQISQILIASTSAFLLAALYRTFDGNYSGEGFIFSFILVVFMASIFYLPIRIQDFFLKPEAPNWRSVIQTMVLLTLFHMGVAGFG